VTYEAWERSVPAQVRNDSLGTLRAYRLSLYAAHLGMSDAAELVRDRRTSVVARQLVDALCSIGANLTEGHGRGTGPDRGRLLEYALGSARESRHWYCVVIPVLGRARVESRLELLTEIVRLAVGLLRRTRRRSIRQESAREDAAGTGGSRNRRGSSAASGQELT
jgi:four helix bundle protein